MPGEAYHQLPTCQNEDRKHFRARVSHAHGIPVQNLDISFRAHVLPRTGLSIQHDFDLVISSGLIIGLSASQ